MFTKHYEGDINKKDEMGATCSRSGVDEKCIYSFNEET
jgi:hypothetical protein